MARDRLAGQFVGGYLIGGIVILRDFPEFAALTGVAGIEGAVVKFCAFAEALDKAETFVVHGGLHHGQKVLGIGVCGAGHERGTGADGLFYGVNGLINRAPHVGLALESDG